MKNLNAVKHCTKKTKPPCGREKAKQLFSEIEERGWITAGISEIDLSDKIFDLAFQMFGTKQHWHKRIVRSGNNTLLPYSKNPPNRIITDDDILFFDFGPV